MKSCLNWTLDKMKSCIYINWTLDKMKSCTYINWTLNNVVLIFVNLTCINQTPVYSEHKADSIIIHCTWHKQVCLDYTRYLSINYYIIVLDMMKTAIIIQIEQLGQYGTKLANTDYFLVLADFDPANIGVQESL